MTVKLVVKMEIVKKHILWILYQLKCHLIMSKLLSFSNQFCFSCDKLRCKN